MASKRESRRLRAIILGGLRGVLVGYAVVSPAATVFFHLSHDSVDAPMVHELQHSVAGNNGDQGTTCRIRLPLQQATVDSTTEVPSNQPRTRPSEKRQIVEESRSAS
jgi:hypothetical protein